MEAERPIVVLPPDDTDHPDGSRAALIEALAQLVASQASVVVSAADPHPARKAV